MIKIKLLLLISSLVILKPAFSSELEDAWKEWRNGNYETSMPIIYKYANEGHARAQGILGDAFSSGKGAPKDTDEAYRLLTIASNKGDPNANRALGNLLIESMKHRDFERAMSHQIIASDSGECAAMSNVGRMYFKGQGVPIDYQKSLQWELKSADCGYSSAYKYIADFYESGLGVKTDTSKATSYYLIAAKKGVAEAQFKIGNRYHYGIDVQKNLEIAADWYKRAEANPNRDGNTFFKSDLASATLVEISEELKRNINGAVAQVGARLSDMKGPDSPSEVKSPKTSIVANRKALIIGNNAYKNVPKLLTAREDAKAMAEGLQKVGYQVTLKTDLDMQGMKAAIRTFKSQVEGGDEVAIFFAGHGVQLANTNFLLPIDISGESEEQIRDDAIPLQRLLDDIAERKAKFTLAMVDACRDNPFKSTNGRSIGGTRGLSPTTAATGQMIVFSAGSGQQALDKLGPNDKEKNGVFTRVFLKQLPMQGVSVDKLIRNVRTEVVGLAKSVGHEQVPAIYDQVVGEFFFKP